MKSVLVAMDGSETSLKAVRHAGMIAAKFGAQLRVVYVFDAWPEVLSGRYGNTPEEGEKILRQRADEVLSKAVNLIEEPGAQVRTEVREGSAAEGILSAAQEHAPDLIVMGSRGMSTVKGLLLGSVSLQVLHSAPCPVTIVR